MTKRSRIDRLFRLWDLLYYFRRKDGMSQAPPNCPPHLKTRAGLKQALFIEYNIDAHGLSDCEVNDCIILLRPIRDRK